MHNPGLISLRLLKPWLYSLVIVGGLVLVGTRSVPYALGVLCGPFAGAMARDWQSCCRENSLAIAPFALGGVLLAVLVQRSTGNMQGAGRLVRIFGAWAAPLIWYLAAVLSYLHALE